MPNTQYLGTNAGFQYSTAATSTTFNQQFLLAVPLREVLTSYRIRQYVAESLDYANREVFTISTGAYEIVATLRYNDDLQALVDFLRYGVRGVPMIYSTNITTGSTAGVPPTGTTMYMIEPTGDMINTLMDRQRGAGFEDVEVTCRFRQLNGGSFSTML